MERLEALQTFYGNYDEQARPGSRCGSAEFITTVHYIEKYLQPGMKVLEIGTGTGRYAHYFARKGYQVDAVELMDCNIEVFKQHTAPGEQITIAQGDALALPFADDQYDITLLLGPMYHLYTQADQHLALAEAIRVTKPGGVIFAAYCSSDMTMYEFCIARGKLRGCVEQGKIDKTFRLLSEPEDIFALYRKPDIDALMQPFPVTRLHFVGTDMLTHLVREGMEALDDDTFAFYMDYHLSICERPDMVGASNHLLDVFRK